MRKTLFTAAFLAVALSASLAAAQPAAMPMMPGGVKMMNGSMTDASGKALYTYDMDTMKGMSHCTAGCATAWPPFLAADDAKPTGEWTIVTREDGKKQWAYKDKPLYYFARDKAGSPPSGGTIPNWHLAQ